MPRFRGLILLALLIALSCSPTAWSASSTMVISQVFAGGGNASAPYANDFVELFNRGSAVADLGGWSLQYASGSGSTWAADRACRVRAAGRALPRPARVRDRRRGAADARRGRHVEPGGLRRKGRARPCGLGARVRHQLLGGPARRRPRRLRLRNRLRGSR